MDTIKQFGGADMDREKKISTFIDKCVEAINLADDKEVICKVVRRAIYLSGRKNCLNLDDEECSYVVGAIKERLSQ